MDFKKEQGMALILVLISLVILSATVVVINTGMKTQANISTGLSQTPMALARAEDGLNLAVSRVTNNETDNFQYTSDDGYNIDVKLTKVSDSPEVYNLTSTASRGRLSRTVQAQLTATQNPGMGFNCSMFTEGVLEAVNGAIDFGNNDVVAINGIDIRNASVANGKLSSPEYVNIRNAAQTNITSQDLPPDTALKLPELDWKALVSNADAIISPSELGSTLSSRKNTGGLVVVEMGDASSINLKKGVYDFPKETMIVFVKDRHNPEVPGDFNVHLNNGTFSGQLSMIAQGSYHFNNISLDSEGIVYSAGDIDASDYAIHINNVAVQFKGGMAARGSIKINNLAIQFLSSLKWNVLQPYMKAGDRTVAVANWREI